MKKLVFAMLAMFALVACNKNTQAGSNATRQQDTAFWVDTSGTTILTRFHAPHRVPVEKGSFAEWLRNLPLKPVGYETHLYDGSLKANKVQCAVIDMEIGDQDNSALMP